MQEEFNTFYLREHRYEIIATKKLNLEIAVYQIKRIL